MSNREQGSPDERLNVGDVGIIIGATFHPETIGRECVVIGALDWYRCRQDQVMRLTYRVELDGKAFLVKPEHIRKKRPPAEDRKLVRWADCPWQPESINV